MTDPNVLIAAIGGVVAVLLALLSGVLAPVILFRLNKAESARRAKAEETDEKLDVIHDLTNSNLGEANKRFDESNARLDKALAEIKSLQALVAEMRSPTTQPAAPAAPAALSLTLQKE